MDDEALVRRVGRGDREALDVLYARHAPWLAVRLRRRCADDELAADVLQETFLSVWRMASGFDGRGSAAGWIWTVASSRLVDAHRRRRVRPQEVGGVELDLAAAQGSAEDVALESEFDHRLSDALQRLSPELRAVLQATVLDGLSTRARRLPAAALIVVIVAALVWWTGTWLMNRPFLAAEQARIPVSALGTLIAAGALSATLAGSDEWLDRSTPAPWRTIRAAHLLLTAGLGAVIVGSAGLSQPQFFGAPAMARGVIGLLAIGALASLWTGARAAWIVVLAYASTVYLAAPRTPGGFAAIWAWPMQPTAVAPSFVMAGVLLTAALVVHSCRGSRPSSDVN